MRSIRPAQQQRDGQAERRQNQQCGRDLPVHVGNHEIECFDTHGGSEQDSGKHRQNTGHKGKTGHCFRELIARLEQELAADDHEARDQDHEHRLPEDLEHEPESCVGGHPNDNEQETQNVGVGNQRNGCVPFGLLTAAGIERGEQYEHRKQGERREDALKLALKVADEQQRNGGNREAREQRNADLQKGGEARAVIAGLALGRGLRLGLRGRARHHVVREGHCRVVLVRRVLHRLVVTHVWVAHTL